MLLNKEEADKLSAKAQLLYYMGYTRIAKYYKECVREDKMPIEIPGTPEEYEKSGGMRTGLIEAEMGMPVTYGNGLQFPYMVTEEDWSEDKREGALYTGFKKFGLQPILDAVGVELTTNKAGKLEFDETACVGKKVKIRYVMTKDSRTAEEGGTGREYPKAVSAHPIDATEDSIGI